MADRVVPIETAEIFTNKMMAAGNVCILKSYPGAGHGFFNYRRQAKESSSYFSKTMKELESFLLKLGWLPVQGSTEH